MDRLMRAEINLSNFAYNIRSIRKIIGPQVKLMTVLKANAYGHGAIELAKHAEKLKADCIGVVCLYEAKQLRENGIKLPILILNYTDPESSDEALDNDITLNVMDKAVLDKVEKYGRKYNKKIPIHVKIDSGMHRAGLTPDDALKFIPTIEKYHNVCLKGIFTHFATSDEKDLSFTRDQLAVFNQVIGQLKEKGIDPPLIHSANSAATLRLKEAHFDMVRPGLILYGLVPSDDFKMPFIPRPVMTLKSMIVQIRRINKGETVGYGRTFKATKETLVAVIPGGYADGIRRGPVNWGEILVHGRKVPILGRISMDQTSIDVTNIPNIKVADEVVLIGEQGKEEITAESIARRIGTINYEVTSAIASRVSRIIIQ